MPTFGAYRMKLSKPRRPPTAKRIRRIFHPQLEWLETRTLPTASLPVGPLVSVLPIAAQEGTLFSGTVGTFTDSATNAATDYSALINWGDGSAPQTVTPTGSVRPFTVSGSHTFTEEGPHIVTVSVTNTALSDAFSSVTNMLTARSQMAAATGSKGVIYLFGGTSGATVEAYNPVTNSWAGELDLPEALTSPSAATGADGKIYVFDAKQELVPNPPLPPSLQFVSKVYAYDPIANTWTSKKAMPIPSTGSSAVTAGNGLIYVFGGSSPSGYSSAVEAYNPATDTWSSKASMPNLTGYAAAALGADGLIYVLGGTNTSGVLSTVQIYNPVTDSWTSKSSMPVGIHHAAATTGADGQIYLFGGEDNSLPTPNVFQTVYAYHPATDTWTNVGNLPEGRISPAAAVSNGQLYVFGGRTTQNFSSALATAGNWKINTGFGSTPIQVTDQAPLVTVLSISPAAGTVFSGDVATFTDPGGNQLASNYSAAIDWGDGTSADKVGTVSLSGGQFTVSGNHTYASGGPQTITVTVTDDGGVAGANTWTSGTSLLTGRRASAAALGSDEQFYVFGGVAGGTAGQIAAVEGFNPATNSWSSKADMPVANNGVTAVSGPDGRIYVLGGNLPHVFAAYNPAADSWQTIPDPSSSGRFYYSPAALGPDGRIYLFGMDGSFAFDPITQMWTTRTAMPVQEFGGAAVLGPDGFIYVFGGYTSAALATVYAYDPLLDTWTQKASMPSARFYMTAELGSDGQIYILGGAQNTPQIYNPATNTWNAGPTMPDTRYGTSGSVGTDGRLYIFGGADSTSTAMNTVLAFTPTGASGINSAAITVASAARPNFKIVVNTAADEINHGANDPGLSLREAINLIDGYETYNDLSDAEKSQVSVLSSGPSEIDFNIPGNVVHTINVGNTGLGELPSIINPVTIDGYTQPGAKKNTDANAFNGTLQIELNGANAGNEAYGLQILGGDSTVRGLVINRFKGQIDSSGDFNGGEGIYLSNNGGNKIEGNFIGTNAAGNTPLGNTFDGVVIDSVGNNTIGGSSPAVRNLISGNALGIGIMGDGTGNVVAGNLIGTNASGTAALSTAAADGSGGTAGIAIGDASSNTIGGTDPGARNVISGNSYGAILIGADQGVTAEDNVIQGNYIGVDVTGKKALGNLIGVGIGDCSNNTVGGDTVAARNIISANSLAGVILAQSDTFGDGNQASNNQVLGNYVGVDVSATTALGNGGGDPTALANIINNAVKIWNIPLPDLTADDIATLQAGVATFEAMDNTIGGTATGEGNVISGNAAPGVLMFIDPSGDVSGGNTVQGNLIGTNASGANLGNAGAGVAMVYTTGAIIGADEGVPNTIAFTKPRTYKISTFGQLTVDDGVIVAGGTQNRITENSIYANQGLGIDLQLNGNNDQPAPFITGVTGSGLNTKVQGNLTAAPDTDYTVEFFFNSPTDSSQGRSFMASTTVTTDADGHATFNADIPPLPAGQFVTATATDPGGNTSRFSQPPIPLVVTTATDENDGGTLANPKGADGLLSLREAIELAEQYGGTQTITFNIPGPTPHIITVGSTGLGALPDLTGIYGLNLTIQGPGQNALTVSGGNQFQVFHVANAQVFDVTYPANATIFGMTISKGNVDGVGAGIYNDGTLKVTDCTISGNSAYGDGDGGGIYNDSSGTLTVSHTTISGNYADDRGGGIYNRGTLTVQNGTVITQNTAQGSDGGGIYNANVSPNPDVVNTIGTLQVEHTELTVENSTISYNTSKGAGGGGVRNNGTAVFTACTINNNTSDTHGGGIDNNGGDLSVVNSTIYGNTSKQSGGATVVRRYNGITAAYDGVGGGVNNDSGTATFTNCTISGNTAGDTGGGIYNLSDATTTLNNTIVAKNTAGNGGPDISNIATLNAYFSLIGNNSGANLGSNSHDNKVGSPTKPLDPMLGSLTNNGGLTQTMALLAGSPAINSGSNTLARDINGTLTTDQRGTGYPRIVNVTVDIGAFELQPFKGSATVFIPHPLNTLHSMGIVPGWVILTNTGADFSGTITVQFAVPGVKMQPTAASGMMVLGITSGTGKASITLSGTMKKGATVMIAINFCMPSYMSIDWLRKNLVMNVS